MNNNSRLASLLLVLATSTSACVGSAGLHLGGSAGGGASAGGGGGGEAGGGGNSVAEGGDSAASTPATKFSDFAFEVKDATGEYYTGWIIDKLTTIKVAPACYQKMLDHDLGAVHLATFYTRDVQELAKKLTGDDWSDIESQNNSDREHNKKLVEPMVEKFRSSYGLTISVDGDDCDANQSALWLRYWGTVSTALNDYPPASGKAFVNLDVRGDTRDVKVAFDDDSSTYTITAPRDIEPKDWTDKIEKPIRKHARQK